MVSWRSARTLLTLLGVVAVLCFFLTTTVSALQARPIRVRHTEILVRSSVKERVGLSSMTFTEKSTLAETRTVVEE